MIHQSLVNLDDIFSRLTDTPIIANDLEITSEEGKERLNNLLYTRYYGDSLTVVPTCDCGAISGAYNENVVCPNCHVACRHISDRKLQSTLWMRVPDNVRAFINPFVWVILSDRMRISGCSILHYLTDVYYQPPNLNRTPPELRKLTRAGIERGLNYFVDNFDHIMSVFFCDGIPLKEWLDMALAGQIARPRNIDTVVFLLENRDKLFTQHLPMPSKIGLVAESNDSGIYIDSATPFALDALHTIASIKNSLTELVPRRLESRVVKSQTLLGEFYQEFVSKTLSGKPGIIRKHVVGNRMHFTARNVITSISEPHRYDELHLPWSTAVQLLDLHITNKLFKLGYTPNQAMKFIRECTRRYDPLMRQIFDELLAEAPLGGLPVIFQRNPTLARGSAQLLRITKIKSDVADNTVSLSVLVLVGFNADFDGDALNMLLILDKAMYDGLSRMQPHFTTFDVNSPRRISGNLKMPVPIAATIDNWLSV